MTKRYDNEKDVNRGRERQEILIYKVRKEAGKSRGRGRVKVERKKEFKKRVRYDNEKDINREREKKDRI